MTLKEAAALWLERARAEWDAWPHLTAAQRTERFNAYRNDGAMWTGANGKDAWCGFFYAWCAREVHPAIRRLLLPSTYRVTLAGTYGVDTNLWPYRRISAPDGQLAGIRTYHAAHGGERKHLRLKHAPVTWPFTPEPGDLVVIGKGADPNGRHITLLEKWDGQAHTISGNGWGTHSDGTIGNGVVKNVYNPATDIVQILRLAPADLDPALKFER